MENNKTATVGSFVANDYRTATVFQKYGIDFCCKGGRSIEEVCTNKNLNATKLLAELAETTASAKDSVTDFKTWSLDLLADYIEKKHHRYIQESTPALVQFLDKLCKVHGGNHPELFDIYCEFSASAGELAAHMQKEELILFPFVRKMAEAKSKNIPFEQASFGSVQNPIHMMMNEHDTEGERFRKIETLCNGYTAPADGCTTYRVAFAMLKEFESDLHMHIHLENNILFPGAVELEKNLA
jgi:regulator of cell morphogenesis and NO signaling